jgi:hypothetical protein
MEILALPIAVLERSTLLPGEMSGIGSAKSAA